MVENKNMDRQKLEDLVTCPICCERLKAPRMLPCQHTLCFDCLGRHAASKMLKCDENGYVYFVETSKGFPVCSEVKNIAFNCPECDRAVEYKKLSSIEKCLKCNQILDLLKSTEKSGPKCKFCENDSSVAYWCIDCDKQFCKKCFEGENCFPSHYCGKLVDPQTISCVTHELELRYLCVNCDIPTCFECFMEHHCIHEVREMSAVGAELRDMLEKSKSLIDGNNDDSNKLKTEIESLKAKHHIDGTVALKEWHAKASTLFEEIVEEVCGQKDEMLVKKIEHIRKDVNALSQNIENIKMKSTEHAVTFRYRSEIEQNLSKCNLQEKEILSIKIDVGQQNDTFLKELKDLFLKKLASLIDKDIDEHWEKDGKRQVRRKDCEQSSPSKKNTQELSPSRPSCNSWMNAKSPGDPLHSAASSAGKEPHAASNVTMTTHAVSRTAGNSPASANQSITRYPVASAVLGPMVRAKEQASPQTSTHRQYRLNQPQSVSCPHRLHEVTSGQNALLRHSDSENDILNGGSNSSNSSPKQNSSKVVIRDPKSGKDVTDSILKNRNRRS